MLTTFYRWHQLVLVHQSDACRIKLFSSAVVKFRRPIRVCDVENELAVVGIQRGRASQGFAQFPWLGHRGYGNYGCPTSPLTDVIGSRKERAKAGRTTGDRRIVYRYNPGMKGNPPNDTLPTEEEDGWGGGKGFIGEGRKQRRRATEALEAHAVTDSIATFG